MSTLTLRCTDGTIECGCRFKYMPEEITTNYHELVKALQEAIDTEAKEHNNQFITNEKIEAPGGPKYDFASLSKEFKDLVSKLMELDKSNSSKITAIVEQYLGKGRKVGDCTQEQVEQLDLIVTDIRELISSTVNARKTENIQKTDS